MRRSAIERDGDLVDFERNSLVTASQNTTAYERQGSNALTSVRDRTLSRKIMNPTRKLHELGQSLWLDNLTRRLLSSGMLHRYMQEFAVTGLTSNPVIFDQAIKNSGDYDDSIRQKVKEGRSGEVLVFELAIDDLRQAADLFRPIYNKTNGSDGWVSLEVSPLLAHDANRTVAAAKSLYQQVQRPNVFIKIPGTAEGLRGVEEAIFAGIPVNVTLLFSREQYLAAAEAYLRGVERRLAAGLNPAVGSVASMFISRWDVAVNEKVPETLRNQMGIAVAGQAYEAYRLLLDSPRWQQILNAGARQQRMLWASTATKDPAAPDTLYVQSLAVPFTVNTMPESTLRALVDHGRIDASLSLRTRNYDDVLRKFAKAGIDINLMAAQLQEEGANSFVESWNDLLECIAQKSKSCVEDARKRKEISA